ncbi:MAG TPA: hypothetical protein VMA98_00075 [Candidatus Acidoferrales bacterium]|nr:hypothetical protein [Candidatus Acidoferrales bacterium]
MSEREFEAFVKERSLRDSAEFRMTHWMLPLADARMQLLNVALSAAPRFFSVAGQKYGLQLYPGRNPSVFEFLWTPCQSSLLPPLCGIANVRRLGPLVSITLRVAYRFADDPASSLAHELLGKSSARRALGYALRAFAALLQGGAPLKASRRS